VTVSTTVAPWDTRIAATGAIEEGHRGMLVAMAPDMRRALGRLVAALFFILYPACLGEPVPGSEDTDDVEGPEGPDEPDEPDEPDLPEPGERDRCPALFDQDVLPEWQVTLSDAEWAALEDEFLNRVARDAADLPINPYHPVERITFDDGSGPIEVPDVLIRLKGQSSWLQTIRYDENPKMQFVIAFNEVNPTGRFYGVRKVELDMPRSDRSFIRHRLALHAMREAGQSAQCANSVRLTINGEYYGLYTHLERLDKEFLQRVYGKANGVDDGDLWKNGREIRTNEENHSKDRLNALWDAGSTDELAALADLDDAVFEWAAEAVMPHADGYHMGRHNYFLYDHPERGFLWLPHDLDTAFDYYAPDLDVVFPRCRGRNYSHWIPYATALSDTLWMDRYVEAIAAIRADSSPDDQVALVNAWADQIRASAETDPRRPFSMERHVEALEHMREYLDLRADFIDDWLGCRESGAGHDADGDGAVFCFDCDDDDSSVHPGRGESCNGVDDDCDGFVDEGC
jgi:hypothetical protein